MAASSKPPIPPRTASSTTNNMNDVNLLAASNLNSSPYSGGLDDSRFSSTQSLYPVESAGVHRRSLLVIYIHGFLGAETSFQSFPAHVHALLTPAVAETHVVYTKIYPRYKSRKNISFARDDFSKWLSPRESESTDVILVGHSLGGILAAEVVLLPSDTSKDDKRLFQHRILGLIAFDTPFLGMHPGVISTGIASLFRAPPQIPVSPLADPEFFSGTAPQSSTYNPTYTNDIHLVERNGNFQKFWYFWNKHCGELAKATGDYLSSHLEFGGCLADYPGLKRRYSALRALEDVDELARTKTPDNKLMTRVRFVNYYSASTGPVKEKLPSSNNESSMLEPPGTEVQGVHTSRSSGESLRATTVSSPRLSLEEHQDGRVITRDITEFSIDSDFPDPPEVIPVAAWNRSIEPSVAAKNLPVPDLLAELDLLPPLPLLPPAPSDFHAGVFKNEEVVKLLRREHERRVKAHGRAVKDREDSLKEREKLADKRRREMKKHEEKVKKEAEMRKARLQNEQKKQSTAAKPEGDDTQLEHNSRNPQQTKPQKDRKFCALPPRTSASGNTDSTWIRVYFEGIDEVTAHTSMFNVSDTYAKMVRDVVERIGTWVAEDASTRMTLDEAGFQS